MKLRSHNTSYCLVEVVTTAGLTVLYILQYVLSGSDDFNLYMWKIPDDLSQSK
jgi:hypothetical protein